jgi:hypothetical protein
MLETFTIEVTTTDRNNHFTTESWKEALRTFILNYIVIRDATGKRIFPKQEPLNTIIGVATQDCKAGDMIPVNISSASGTATVKINKPKKIGDFVYFNDIR